MKSRILGVSIVALLLAITQQVALAVMPPSYMVFFDYGRSSLSAQAGKTLAEFVYWYKFRGDTWQVAVYGYTDTAESSEALSQARGEAVRQKLVELGIPFEQILVFGMGDKWPLVQTKPNTREPQNRRVETVRPRWNNP